MNEDIHTSNLSLRTQGLAWLFYKRAGLYVRDAGKVHAFQCVALTW